MPLLGLQARGLDGREKPLPTIGAMAAHYIGAVRETQPVGPYRLGGHSLGGRIAQDMARQLEAAGEKVEFLAAIDTSGTDTDLDWIRQLDEVEALAFLVSQIEAFHGRALDLSVDDLRAVVPEASVGLVVDRMKQRRLLPETASTAEVSGVFAVYKANMRAVADFTPQICCADIHVFATRALCETHPIDLTLGWGGLTRGTVHVAEVPGEHMTMLTGNATAEIARRIVEACNVATNSTYKVQLD